MNMPEEISFPARIPFGQEILTRWLKNGAPVSWRMIVLEDKGGVLEADFVFENELGEEVYGYGGTTSREQILSVGEAWDMERAVAAYKRSFEKSKVKATPERLEAFRQRWSAHVTAG